MFGVAQFRPRIGEIDIYLSGYGGEIAGKSQSLAADNAEIGQGFSVDLQPDLPGPLKSFLHSDPIELGILPCPLPYPLPIAAAIFDNDRLGGFKKGKGLLSVVIMARDIEKSIQKNRMSLGPLEGND